MAEEEKQDGQKTIVAFVVGLLIGGMLVWAFSDRSPETGELEVDLNTSEEVGEQDEDETNSDNDETTTDSEDTAEDENSTLQVGDGEITVNNQPAAATVQLESATYPVSEGWIGVRDFNNDKLGPILGVVRFSESQGLVPDEIVLLRTTVPGNQYAVVVFTENGDFDFSLANDVQIDTIYSTFIAQ